MRLKIKKKEIFLSDVHVPFEDEDGLNVFFELGRDFKPDIVWLGGDILDDYNLSSYIKSNQIAYQEEIERVKDFLSKLRNIFPRTRIVYQEGNHEQRFRNYILKRAGHLEFLLNKNLSFEELLELEKLKIYYITGPAQIAKLYHIHGHEKRVYGQLVHVALNYIRWLHKSVIFGHWHVAQKFPIKEIDGTYKEAYANPCLFDPHKMPYKGYAPIDLFHRGFSFITYYEYDLFHVDIVLLLEHQNSYTCFYRNEMLIFERKNNQKKEIYRIEI